MRLASHLAALAVATVALPSIASATTIASNSTSTLYAGYSAIAPALPPDAATAATYNISNGGGVWTGPLAGSSYVSFHPNTEPGGSYTAPNGYYDYKINFNETGSAMTLTVLADDTVAVYLNGLTQVLNYAPGPFPHCATGTPNCITPVTVTFATPIGNDYLDFEVHQANLNATGLDFVGTTVTPEPNTLMLLGTGLVGSAGAMLRRFRRS